MQIDNKQYLKMNSLNLSMNKIKRFILFLAQVIELTYRNNMLSSSIMEETGGLGVDYIIDNGGK